MRLLPTLTALTLLIAAPQLAHAQQLSDADRKAARELYFAGESLQNAGKFAEALDKFQRAQSVVNAPTTLLHIAECQAALGKLVESTETYRAVGRFPMPPSPPQAFVAAQSQAAAELAQVEPRIPEVTIDVTPQNIPTLQVTVDDQQVPTALIGVSRPVNPGPHKVVAQAAGYSREEKTIDVKERSKLKIPIELKSTGAVTYGVAGAAQPAPTTTIVNNGQNSGTPPPPAPAAYDPNAASKDKGQGPEQKAPEQRSRTGIILGPRLGAAIPAGRIPLSNGTTPKANDYSSAGFAIGVEAALRFARVVFVGGMVQGESYGNGTGSGLSRSSSGGVAAFNVGWISNPDGVGVILSVGAGYRWYTLKQDVATPSNSLLGGSFSSSSEDSSSSGVIRLGVGIPIKIGRLFRLVPEGELDFGSLKSSTPAPNIQPAQAAFTFGFIGLSGDFDINLDKSANK